MHASLTAISLTLLGLANAREFFTWRGFEAARCVHGIFSDTSSPLHSSLRPGIPFQTRSAQ